VLNHTSSHNNSCNSTATTATTATIATTATFTTFFYEWVVMVAMQVGRGMVAWLQ